MEPATTPVRRTFRRRPFGYAPTEVDTYVEGAVHAYETVRSEVDRLRVAEPLTRVGSDVAALIASFADTVASLREAAENEAEKLRSEAESYARAQRAEAERILSTSQESGQAVANELLSRARAEISAIAEERRTVERALAEAAAGVTAALQALARLTALSEEPGPAIDLAAAPAHESPLPVETEHLTHR
jgi:cell division septum initiation protein DivIVA